MKFLDSSRRILGLAAVGLAGAGLTAAMRAPAMVKGVTYRVKVETKLPSFAFGGAGAGGGNADIGGGVGGGGGGGGGFGGGVGQLVRVALAGDRAKVEFQLGNPPGSSITDYYLILLDSNKTYRVSPEAQTFSDASLAANGGRGGRGFGGGGGGGFGGAGRANRGDRGGGNNGGDNAGRGGRGAGANPFAALTDAQEVSDVKANVEDLGAGEVIETRPTKHYRVTVNYSFKLYGQPRQAQTTTEVWTVDFPQRVINPFEAATATGDSGTMADVARTLITEAKKLPGVPVKVVTTQTIPVSAVGADQVDVAANGSVPQTISIVRTTAITALKEADVDDADLKIPDGYKKVSGFGRGGQ
jgi:hypothetical protein